MSAWSWTRAVYTAVGGAACVGVGSSGLFYDKQLRETGLVEEPLFRPVAIISLLFWLAGHIIFVVAMGMGSQIVVVPAFSLMFCFNIFFGRFLGNFELYRRTFQATGLVALGTVFCLIAAPKTEPNHTVEDLLLGYGNTYRDFIVVELVCLLVFELLFRCSPVSTNIKEAGHAGVSALVSSHGMVQLKIASVSGHQIVATEASSGLLSMMAVGVFAGAIFHYWYLSRARSGLRLLDPQELVPMMQVFWLGLQVVACCVFFREWEDFAVTMMPLYFFGAVLIGLGIWNLTPDSGVMKQAYEDRMLNQSTRVAKKAERHFRLVRRMVGAGLTDFVPDELIDFVERTRNRSSRRWTGSEGPALPPPQAEARKSMQSGRASVRNPDDLTKKMTDASGGARHSVSGRPAGGAGRISQKDVEVTERLAEAVSRSSQRASVMV